MTHSKLLQAIQEATRPIADPLDKGMTVAEWAKEWGLGRTATSGLLKKAVGARLMAQSRARRLYGNTAYNVAVYREAKNGVKT